ncbi:FAD-dependent oxidoreductase [Kineosporia sp. A_224]|uniref:GcvT family protein n=1 Tax=Kineosporia sp. A_224 TaxID=1962180 RepID=UPI0018E9904C|nr:FAD-dependent oxidoreductase [Kineosporia sp. A_224]
MSDPAALPSSARVVVIGGGVGGASVAYHLAQAGERDVLLLERADLTSGSTFHSAGLVGVLRADPTLTRMNMHSAALYAELQGGEHPPGWVPSGGLKLASSPERLEEIRRQVSWAKTYGLGLEEISVAEAVDLFPLMDPTGVVGAAWLPEDGWVDPSSLCLSLVAGARAGGVEVRTRTRVTGIDTVTLPGGRRRVSRVRTDRGDVECEVVVDCGGMFAAQIARMVGVRVPLVPMAHQYIVTEPLLTDRLGPREKPLPTLRDPDWLVYWRQEVDGLLMGGYERDPAPWTASTTSFDDVPADFNGRLLPEDWDRFEQIAENSRVRVPAMDDVGVRKLINGPEAFTPDNEFCLGESEVGGFFVAAGFCAHGIAGAGGIGQVMAEWVLEGSPSLDVWHMDIRRFGPAYDSPSYTLARTVETYATYYDIAYPHRDRTAGRPLRTSPAFEWHTAHGAHLGEKAGWERVDWYEANAAAGEALLAAAGGVDAVRPRTWAGRSWSPAIAAEHHGARTAAALFDETSFAKLAVTGPDAALLLERVSAGRVDRAVGSVTYTQWLNHRGGIEADVTVTRTADDAFVVVTGTAFGLHDLSWLRRRADDLTAQGVGTGHDGRLDARIEDVTGQYVCYGLWGPKARDVLGPLTPQSLSNKDFPFLSSRATTVGDVPVRLVRVTFVGELGWEVYASSEYGAALWRTLWEAGRPHGLVAAGYRAIDSLRLEKGYRVWAGDLTPETTPDEAGLSFAVKLDKPGGFVGADALRAARVAGGPARSLACVTLDDPRAVAVGSEPVRVVDGPHAGEVAGRVTSAGYGWTVAASILYSYLPVAAAVPGTRVEVDLFGEWVGGTVADGVLHDPTSARVRADG